MPCCLQGEVDYLVAQKRELEVERDAAVGAYRNKDKELAARDAELSAVASKHQGLGGELAEKDRQLKDTSRRQLAYTGSQLAEESADLSGKAVDAMLESFLTPRRALDMQTEVARKKATARSGQHYPPPFPL